MLQNVIKVASVFCNTPLVDGKRPTGGECSAKLEGLEFENYISGRLVGSRSMT